MPPIWKSRKVIPSGYSECTIELSGPNSLHPPSFSFGLDSDEGSPIGTFLGDWLGDDDDGFQQVLYSQYVITGVKLRLTDSTQEIASYGPGEAVSATLSPPNVSALIKGIGTIGGKRGRARMYWPGVMAEADVDNAGTLDSGHLADLQRIADYFFTAATAAGIAPVILHSYRWPWADPDPGPPVGFPSPTAITNWIAQPVIATQRRRVR